jgi:hypothetical protein
MEMCWQQNPEERPSFNDIYNSLGDMLTNNEVNMMNFFSYQRFLKTNKLSNQDFYDTYFET